MRLLLPAVFSLFLLFPVSAQAVVVSGQCSLDQAVDDGNQQFNQCPFGDENDFLIDQGYNGARLEPDNALSFTPIWVHDICRYVDARGIADSLFIPFNTLAEWQAFVNNAPDGVHLAECCLPRPLKVGDVPPITAATNQTCSTGWVFDGLVNPSNFNQLLATPNGTSNASTFSLAGGVSENPNYPITGLPIQRDDIGAMLPQGANGGQSYVAKYRCTVTSGNSTTTNVQLIQFALTCENNDWAATGPTCASGPFSIFSEACPGGASGTLIKQLVRACPSQAVTVETLSDTCSGACVPGQVGDSFTVPCTAPLGGLITRIHVRQCPSGQIVDQDIASTCQLIPCSNGSDSCPANATNTDCVLVGNQCACTCTGGSCPTTTTLANTTQDCPTAGQTGHITFQNIRACHASNNQCICTISSTQISNTCTSNNSCTPVTVTNETRSCPSGQTGSISVKITRLCFSRKPIVGSSESVTSGNTHCFCITNEQQTANTCTGCPASTDLGNTTEDCPAGQTGLITKHHTRTCASANNTCTCTDHFDEVSNTCQTTETGCTSVTDLGNSTLACPDGQTGSIVVDTKKICELAVGCAQGGDCSSTCTCHNEQTTVSDTCVGDCPASTDLGNHTLACPSGQTGLVTLHRVKECTAANGQCTCTLTDTVVTDTCTGNHECVPVTDLGTATRNCPSGQDGQITVQRKKVCTACFGVCQCSIQEIPISNTCTPPQTCVPVTDLGNTTQACPDGQTGVITINTKRFCEAVCTATDGGTHTSCACHDVSSTVSNTCVPSCTPSQHTETAACPNGQSGSIVTTISHVCDCPGGRDVVTSVVNTCVSTCIPTERTVCLPCPSGFSGSITRTIAHICDCPGGRDVITSEDRWCFPTNQTYPFPGATP